MTDQSSEMNLSTALSEARKMASFFKAFSRIEEVVRLVSSLENKEKAARASISDLEDEVGKLTKARNTLIGSVEGKKGELGGLEAAITSAKRKLAKEQKDAVKVKDQELSVVETQITETKGRHSRFMNEIKQEKAHVEGEIEVLRTQMTKFRESLAKVNV